MSNFPSLRPATRQFSFGEYPVSMQTGFGGGTVRFLHGIGRSAVVMELTYQNLAQAEAKLIRDHYRIRQGSHQDFLLPDALWAGHSGPANIVPRTTRWKYGSQPEETQKRGGYVDLTVSLISVTVITSMDAFAPGMSRTLTLALSAGSATGGGGGGGSDPDFTGVALLLPFSGTNGSTVFTDASSNNLTVTPGGSVQISTAQSNSGGSSAYFDGTGDNLTISDPIARLGATDFTVEMFIRPDATQTGVEHILWSQVIPGSTDNFPIRLRYRFTGTVSVQMRITPSTPSAITGTTVLSTSSFTHIAYVRSSGVHKLYVNGTQEGGTLTDSRAPADSPVIIGGGVDSLDFYKGYIDDYRITKGIARYTSNFTPPTAPFPTS
jgi:hypothetical protein